MGAASMCTAVGWPTLPFAMYIWHIGRLLGTDAANLVEGSSRPFWIVTAAAARDLTESGGILKHTNTKGNGRTKAGDGEVKNR